jgi:group II intron reverse transcriptase/maturase
MRTDQPDDRSTAAREDLILLVRTGPEAGREIHIRALPCTLGRGGRSRIVLADPDDPPALSREHATLSRRSPGNTGPLVVTDHSTNGTRASNRWLERGETASLHPGDELQLGPTLVLECGLGNPSSQPDRGLGAGASQSAIRNPQPAIRILLAAPETLRAAWRRVELNRGAAGPDGVTVREFALGADRRLAALRELLASGRYQPLPPRLFAAPKRSGGVRTIAILSVQDRVVQHALHAVLQPLLEPLFPPCSFAYRPGICPHHALRRVDGLLAQGLTWVAETDIASFFDNIAHRVLLEKLGACVPDPSVLALVARCLAAGAVAPGLGIPQGAATSPLFSNLYLAEFDCHLEAGGWNLVRYGDDLLVCCAARGEAQAALAEAESYLRSQLLLSLQPEKTRVVSVAQGFTFLGFRFTPAGRQPSPRAVAQLNERLEAASPAQAPAVLRGWRQYFGEEGSGVSEGSGVRGQGSGNTSPLNPEPATREAGTRLNPLPDDECIERFLELFAGREDAHARQTWSGDRGRFTPCAGPLTPAHIRAHLAGEETFAAYLVRRDGMVRTLILDLDLSRSSSSCDDTVPRSNAGIRESSNPQFAIRNPQFIEPARELRRVCRAVGLPACLEDSGRRGRHLWIFFSGPIAPDLARRLGRRLAAAAGFPRPEVRLEVFPRHPDWPGPELGDAVKLPFGVHPATGRRCYFLDAEEEPITDPADALAQVRTVSPDDVEALIRALGVLRQEGAASFHPSSFIPQPSEIGRLLAGCAVIRGLVEKAERTGHLRHTHNLILLYTAGRLGEEGARFIHETVANCRNYDPEVCQKYIDRLDPDRLPISCARIREWLEEEGEQHLCTCPRSQHTPLDGIPAVPGDGSEEPGAARRREKLGARKPACEEREAQDTLSAEEEALWTQVAGELFE